jgi:Glycosyltransferases involved in cell wall biogenesis
VVKISIITAVYNNREHVGACIQSVLSQTYSNVEYIIVDGESTDGTVEVIRSFEGSVAKWVSEPDKGIYDALNKGIGMATGDVTGILHSDDLFGSHQILEHVAGVFEQTGCDAVYGDLVYVSRTDSEKVIRYWKSAPFDVRRFKQGWMPAHPTLFLKKKVYDTYGLFDLRFKIAADYDLILRTLASGKLKCEYLPEIITRMRVGGTSNKSIGNILKKSCEDYKALRRNHVGGFVALARKNVSKLGQFFHK